MTHTLNRSQFRFADEVPVMGSLCGGMAIAASGHISITGLTRYVLVTYTDEATVGMSLNLYDQPGPKTAASIESTFSFHEMRIPSLEDFVPEWRKDKNITSEPTKEDRARRYISTFLQEVYALSKLGDTDTAGLKIFDFLDRLLIDELFTVCDDILSMVEVELLDTKLMRSFLSITAPAKKKLLSRVALYKKIEQKMLDLRGPERARRILANLA